MNLEPATSHFRIENPEEASKEGALFRVSLDHHLRFNANSAIMNNLPLDVIIQLGVEPGRAERKVESRC